MATLQPDYAATGFPPRPVPGWLLPVALVLLLTAVWTAQHWPSLSAGRLPDTDDMMRLAQIRDWIGGQSFSDLSQHRLGVGGLAMHWSRIGDIGPASLMLLLRPFANAQAAELAAVIIWPATLFLVFLFALRRIAHDLGDPPSVSIVTVLGALAYPTIASFMPGRIDHHGLQAVLVTLAVAAVTAPSSRRAGLVGGIASAASLALGLEAAPLLLAAMVAVGLMWAGRGAEEDNRVRGFAAGFSFVVIAVLLWLRPLAWDEGWCDALTPAAGRILFLMAGAWSLLALAGERVTTPPARLAAGAGVAGLAGAVAASWSPICFTGPYGPVDPTLMRLWMANVAEAGPLFGIGGVGLAWAQGGLIAVAAVVLAHRLVVRSEERRCWWPFALIFLAGATVMIVQIRLTYLVAGLATAPLAMLVARLRARTAASRSVSGAMFAAWIGGTGIVHGMAGQAIAARSEAVAAPSSGPSCTSAEAMRVLAQLPPGRVAAPIDAGAYLIGMTRHAALAAPYHRNNAGNRLVYDLMLAPPAAAREIAAAAGVRYMLFCPSAFGEIEAEPGWATGLAGQVRRGAAPDWLAPIAAPPGLAVFRTDFE